MITSWTILDLIVMEPFQPFRLRMAGGSYLDVRYPEMIAVGATTISVLVDVGQGKKWDHESLERIEAIEPLEVSSPMNSY